MPGILHVELVEQTPTAMQLRLWGDNPNDIRTRTLVLAEIEHLVGKAETDYYSPLPAKLQEVGQALFRWLDGGERWLTAAIKAAANREPVFVLAISTPHRLGHLPWEVLHDGKGFLVHGLNPAVLPVRWRNVDAGALDPKNRPLQALFMASSPQNVLPVLDYEGEENAILEATKRSPVDMTVEESGSLEELGALVQDFGDGFFDVLHLTGHAGHSDDGPFLVLEDSEGQEATATPLELARELRYRPPLVFLSGCRTGQDVGHGEVRSFAEQLIEHGFRAVLGWGRPVRDVEATAAAGHVYEQLASGAPLAMAVAGAHAELAQAGARDWHLLRLFCAGDPPGGLVTPPRARGRKQFVGRPAESEFLDPLTHEVKVATRAGFVGRRRLLQRAIRRLRYPTHPHVGMLLHGQGGRGKSSVAARVCDRLREYERVVVVGRLDETTLVNAWARRLPDEAAKQSLRDHTVDLRSRIEQQLRDIADRGLPVPLFVLDDFEQNQPGQETGDLAIAPEAAGVLLALCEALEFTGLGRLLITCRYVLPAPFAGWLHTEDVVPLDAAEQRKQALRLDQKRERKATDPALLAQAFSAADGNPRLFEWLHAVLEQDLDHAAILAELEATEERFREHILARHLVASLGADDRTLLARMLLVDVPIPLVAAHVLASERDADDLRRALRHAVDLGLADLTLEGGEEHYRVVHQLGGGEPPVLPSMDDAEERTALSNDLFDVLYHLWWRETDGTSEPRMLTLIQLAAQASRRDELVLLAQAVMITWLEAHRYPETAAVFEPLLDIAGRDPGVILNVARAKLTLGDGEAAGALLKEAVAAKELADDSRAAILFHYAGWLRTQGEFEDTLAIVRDQLIPLLKKNGNERELAVALGTLADVLMARGELDEALRIRREEQLPVYERLGEVRARAVTQGKITDVLMGRGELDEALRILRDDVLPVFQRLGDVRARAVMQGKIADVLMARGELAEALRIRREEELPVYERLGDVRSRAVTQGQIADVLMARGELDEALRILRDDLLPVFKRLGDVRECAMAQGKIAEVLMARGELGEALRILRDDLLPVFERLGDVRSRAVTQGQIADVLMARGELDEALRILRDDLLPVFERLGDVRERAVTQGKIADVLIERGKLDEALRIRREEQLPAYERLGDVRSLIIGRVNLALLLLRRGSSEDGPEIVQHLVWAYRTAAQRNYSEVEQIAEVFSKLEIPLPED
jgi:tetratricopeptide (TPR) repeat protein